MITRISLASPSPALSRRSRRSLLGMLHAFYLRVKVTNTRRHAAVLNILPCNKCDGKNHLARSTKQACLSPLWISFSEVFGPFGFTKVLSRPFVPHSWVVLSQFSYQICYFRFSRVADRRILQNKEAESDASQNVLDSSISFVSLGNFEEREEGERIYSHRDTSCFWLKREACKKT